MNSSKKDLFEKRKAIRDSLRKTDYETYFSEELPDICDGSGAKLPLDVYELLQVDFFDLVINLADSPGSLAEAEAFSSVLGSRLLLWLPESSKRGFAAGLVDSLQLLGTPPELFSEEDVQSCVMKSFSEDWVECRRMVEVVYEVQEKLINQKSILRRHSIQ